MFDPEDLPLTTEEGRRPSSTAGDRMMVGLAALALFGGALIAIGKVLPQSEAPQTSEATATAQPTAEATRTPRPSPTPRPLRSFQVEPGTPPDGQPQPEWYSGWARALEEVTIFGSDDPESVEMGVLHAGDAAYVDEIPEADGGTPGWFQVQEPTRGWVRAEIDGREVLRLFPWEGQGGGWIDGLVSGPDGFVLLGYSPQEGVDHERVFATSDGRSWQKHDPPFGRGYYGAFLAYGPAGWLAVVHMDGTGGSQPWLWQSADAVSWESLGSLASMENQSGGFGQLVANDSGYVLLSYNQSGYGGDGVDVWFSTDGVLWSERRVPAGFPDPYAVRLTATPNGFFLHYSLDGGGWQPEEPSPGAFSPDGWTWSTVSSSADSLGPFVGVGAASEDLVAIERINSGRVRVWVGTITGEEMAWTPDRGAGSAFDGAVVTAIVSDGTTPIAFGWERFTETPLWWMRRGDSWQRHELPQDYHGLPQVAVGGPAGYLLVGSSHTVLGDNPTIWSLSSTGVWQEQATTLIDPVASPTAQDCAAYSNDLIELIRNSGTRVACFGDAPLSFRAFASACDGCYYEYPGTSEPEWLAQPTDASRLYLSPAEVDGWETLDAVLAPSLELKPRWLNRWLEVSGHFDDPASAKCRRNPLLEEEHWYQGRESVIDECRSRFVITEVRLAR
ncbi:MAG TPA: hypothetical protein VFH90_03520 [Candidatus Limnocylindria bacterium]|nr:hypothetical protein [Candidatus Limnocylindria bacterium]